MKKVMISINDKVYSKTKNEIESAIESINGLKTIKANANNKESFDSYALESSVIVTDGTYFQNDNELINKLSTLIARGHKTVILLNYESFNPNRVTKKFIDELIKHGILRIAIVKNGESLDYDYLKVLLIKEPKVYQLRGLFGFTDDDYSDLYIKKEPENKLLSDIGGFVNANANLDYDVDMFLNDDIIEDDEDDEDDFEVISDIDEFNSVIAGDIPNSKIMHDEQEHIDAVEKEVKEETIKEEIIKDEIIEPLDFSLDNLDEFTEPPVKNVNVKKDNNINYNKKVKDNKKVINQHNQNNKDEKKESHHTKVSHNHKPNKEHVDRHNNHNKKVFNENIRFLLTLNKNNIIESMNYEKLLIINLDVKNTKQYNLQSLDNTLGCGECNLDILNANILVEKNNYMDSINVIYRQFGTKNIIDFHLLSNFITSYSKENPKTTIIIISEKKENVSAFTNQFKNIDITCGNNTDELQLGMALKSTFIENNSKVELKMFAGKENLIKGNTMVDKKVPKVITIY